MISITRFFWKRYTECVLCIFGVVAVVCCIILWLVDQDTREKGEQALLANAMVVEEMVRPYLQGHSDASLADRLRNQAIKAEMRFTVLASDGTVLLDTEQDPVSMGNQATRHEIYAARVVGLGRSMKYVQARDELATYIALPVRGEQDEFLGFVRSFGYISATREASRNDSKTDLLVFVLIAGLALAVAVGPLLGTYLTYRRVA